MVIPSCEQKEYKHVVARFQVLSNLRQNTMAPFQRWAGEIASGYISDEVPDWIEQTHGSPTPNSHHKALSPDT
jgi:hypothetical protein